MSGGQSRRPEPFRPDLSHINSSPEKMNGNEMKKMDGPRDKGMCYAPAGPENV